MASLDTSGIRALAQSLRETRESLVPVAASHGYVTAGLHSAGSRAAWGDATSMLDSVLLVFAGELDYLQAFADSGADAWAAAEHKNTVIVLPGGPR
jgi:hypothetical protein